jgi:hypothetical protein
MSRGNDDALHNYQGSRARCTSQRFSIGGFSQISPAPTMRIAVVVAAIAAFVGVADAFSSAAITPNTKLPAVNLHYGFPPVLVNLAPYAGGKTMIIVGLPGAVRWRLCCSISSILHVFVFPCTHQFFLSSCLPPMAVHTNVRIEENHRTPTQTSPRSA